MKVLITGAAGFLGRHFSKAHLDAGDVVVAVDDFSSPHARWLDFHWDTGGFYNTEQMDALQVFSTEGWKYDLAYHFAAPVGGREKIEGDPLFNAHSLALDSAFFRWAVKNTKRAVYPSSSAVYGVALQGDHAAALGEDLFCPGKNYWARPDEMYGFAKMAGEVLAWTAEKYGLSTLCLRPFSGYGEGQSFEYPVPSIAARALRREDPLTVWGSGKQARDFIHVDDLVRLTLARLHRPVGGCAPLNLGSGRATTFRQVAEICAEIVGYKPTIVTDEKKPEGVRRRWADITQQADLSDQPLISLRTGLTRVLQDVEQRLSAATV